MVPLHGPTGAATDPADVQEPVSAFTVLVGVGAEAEGEVGAAC